MVLHFLCPQGHHLTAPPERAGRPGACPRCQTRFLIPDRRNADRHAPNDGDSAREPLTAQRLPDQAAHSLPVENDSPASKHSWPGIVAGLLASAAGTKSKVRVELIDGREFLVLDMLLARSTGDVAVLVVEQDQRRDVIAVPWNRLTCCRLEGWKAVNETRPLGQVAPQVSIGPPPVSSLHDSAMHDSGMHESGQLS